MRPFLWDIYVFLPLYLSTMTARLLVLCSGKQMPYVERLSGPSWPLNILRIVRICLNWQMTGESPYCSHNDTSFMNAPMSSCLPHFRLREPSQHGDTQSFGDNRNKEHLLLEREHTITTKYIHPCTTISIPSSPDWVIRWHYSHWLSVHIFITELACTAALLHCTAQLDIYKSNNNTTIIATIATTTTIVKTNWVLAKHEIRNVAEYLPYYRQIFANTTNKEPFYYKRNKTKYINNKNKSKKKNNNNIFKVYIMEQHNGQSAMHQISHCVCQWLNVVDGLDIYFIVNAKPNAAAICCNCNCR